MSVDRQFPLSRKTEHLNHFESGGSRRVLDAHAYSQAASIQLRTQARAYGVDLLWRCGLVCGRPALGQNFGNTRMGSGGSGRQWSAEHLSTSSHMARRRAVMDQRVAFLGLQELGDVRGPDFQIQCCRYSVQSLEALTLQLLAVLVQIDEAGSDHETFDPKYAPSLERLG